MLDNATFASADECEALAQANMTCTFATSLNAQGQDGAISGGPSLRIAA